MANNDIKIANQPQGSTNTPASPAGQPTSFRGGVDRDRVKAQIRRWQDRVLDLTKSNPLIGLNRSRVAKLQVIEPDTATLFGTFAVDENHLRMPLDCCQTTWLYGQHIRDIWLLRMGTCRGERNTGVLDKCQYLPEFLVEAGA